MLARLTGEVAEPALKECTGKIGCGHWLPGSAFYKDANKASRLTSACRQCVRKHQRSQAGKAAISRYKQSPRGKAARARWWRTLAGKASRARYSARYNATPEGAQKRRARGMLYRAVHKGRMIKPERCQLYSPAYPICKGRIEGHHHLGYDREHWLDVQWLCHYHHYLHDMAERRTRTHASPVFATAGVE